MTRSRPLVAIVDDDDSVRRAFSRLLRSGGLKTALFETGESFLEAVKTTRPDAVVLDLHLPGIHGLVVQRELKACCSEIPVIVVTGFDEPESEEKAMAAGAAAFLTKPLGEESLLEVLRRILAGAN